MIDETHALEHCAVWELVPLLPCKRLWDVNGSMSLSLVLLVK